MRNPEDVAANHLVVDASAFLKNVPLQDIGAIIYTVPSVIREIKDKQTRERLACLPYDVKTQEASAESLKIVKEISKKTGDFAALSLTDLQLLALAHDLHTRYDKTHALNYDVKSVLEQVDASKERADTVNPYGWVKASSAVDVNASGELGDGKDDDDDDEDDDEGWVDESNLINVLEGEEEGIRENCEGLLVALISSDFAIQNVVVHMRMNLLSINGLRIKSLKSYLLRCRACYKTTSNMEKKFCPKCGNEALHRVAVTVKADGSIVLHINWQKLISQRNTHTPMRTIKGGKHDNCDRFFEDQRMPHNRASKLAQCVNDDSPFQKHDVVSRSAQLGIRPDRRLKQRRR